MLDVDAVCLDRKAGRQWRPGEPLLLCSVHEPVRSRVLGAPATLAAVHGPTQLLGNHATVSSLLKIAVPGVFPSCHPRLAAGLRIYPPNQRTSKVVPLPVETCPGSFMFVSEVQPSKQVEYP
jgi:hypothetical protein